MHESIIEVKVRLKVRYENRTTLMEVVNEMDYQFNDTTGMAVVTDTELTDWEEEIL